MITLEVVDTEFGVIKIYESCPNKSRAYYQGTHYHSLADPKGHSLFPYVHAMYGVLTQAHAHKIAVLGCAGGTLATMLAANQAEVTVVDINPCSFKLARKYFQLPPDVECVVDDARHYLATTTEMFDAIALDAFDNEGIPAHLRTVEFFRVAATRLNPNGIIVVNTIPSHYLDRLADCIGASIHEASQLPVTLLDEPGVSRRNVIVIAARVPRLRIPHGTEPLPIQEELERRLLRPIRRFHILYDEAAKDIDHGFTRPAGLP